MNIKRLSDTFDVWQHADPSCLDSRRAQCILHSVQPADSIMYTELRYSANECMWLKNILFQILWEEPLKLVQL